MQLTESDLRPSIRPPQRTLSPIRKMYLNNIELIKELGRTYTHDEACKILTKRTGVQSKGPTLKKFCKDKNISFNSFEKKSRCGRLGGIARWKKATSENKSTTTSN